MTIQVPRKAAVWLKHHVFSMFVVLGLASPDVAGADSTAANLLLNPGFELGSASAASSFTGTGPGPSAAADWGAFNLTLGTTRTNVLSSTGAGRHPMLHVTTNGSRNGVVNVFLPAGTGPMRSVSFARVFVVRGQVALGTGNGGETSFDTFSQTTGSWEILVGIHDGSPANEFILYAATAGGAEFYVDSPNVLAVESNGATHPTLPTLRSGGACDGVFSGNFDGDIRVSAGQNCVVVDGTITGNVWQRGGNLILAGNVIGGNVHITNGTFSIGPLTTINGNLHVHHLPRGRALNQICGSTIQDDLHVHYNGAAVQIGSHFPSCTGNVVGGDLQVHSNSGVTSIVANTVAGNLQDNGNTGFTQIFGNVIEKWLRCHNNRMIAAGSNTAQRTQGQCVGP